MPARQPSQFMRQQRLMVAALTLLLLSLGFILYRDRDFWFPEAEEAVDQPVQNVPQATSVRQAAPDESKSMPTAHTPKRSQHRTPHPTLSAATSVPVATSVEPPPTTITRTLLPPLEVEVVAGSVHRTVRPGTNSVKVDVQTEENAGEGKPASAENDAPANVTANAAEHAEISAEPADVISHSVQPGYPMLARQMKVQGSVILQAMIGRDGMIQDLRVLSGPPMLATAAQEAVKQWHFKPHYEGAEAVETQAKITVNFTISTN